MISRSAISIAVFLIMCIAQEAKAQDSFEGHWEGMMVREGSELFVTFEFARSGETFKGTFSAPGMRALGVPFSKIKQTGQKAHFELTGDRSTIVFDGEINAEKLSGEFREGDARGTFSLRRTKPPGLPFKQEDIFFKNGEAILAGTLLTPLSKSRHPAVVFLHGAGPEGRFGSRFLAEEVARKGIAALIYDKRGVGESKGASWTTSSFEDIAMDAVAGINFLKQRSEIDPKKIGIYGHSNGGFIAPLVVSLSADISFAIAAASHGGVAWEQDIYRVRNAIGGEGYSESEIADAMKHYTMFVHVARTGEGWPEFEAQTEKVRKERWFDWLGIPPRGNWIYEFYRKTGNYNPIPLWEKLKVPVLLIYGEKDAVIPVSQSIVNIERALRKAGNRDYGIIILPRAAHNFTVIPDPNQPFEWPVVAPGFTDLVTAWINQQTATSR